MSKFLYIFIFISNISIGQIYYSNYINETYVRRYEAHRYLTSLGGGISSTAYVTEYIDGTATYNGYTYYKLYYKFIRFGSLMPTQGPEYIREDSNGKFYKLNTTNNIESVFYDNSLFQNIENGTPINNQGNVDIPTSCTANISYISVDGLNLKKVESIGYKIEGIPGIYKGGICTGITYFCPTCPYDYDLLYSYTKNGSTYIENSTVGGNLSNYPPLPAHLSIISHNIVETKIFPNPTSNFIDVQCNSKISFIEIFDIQGRKIESVVFNDSEIKLDFSKYQTGTYFIKFNTDSGNVTKKIIKE